MPEFPDISFDEEVLTKRKSKLEKPKLYKVILHNDDYTTMDFVVFILQYVYKRTDVEAYSVMMKVHNEGIGIAGVYPYEIAVIKSEKTKNLANSREFPLLCTIEAE